jgi:transketolase|tara:strand:+ start:169 stop:2121 length:1953 start_codon:yes stop_codon:yes gene_type:complete
MDAVQKAKSGHPGAPMGMADVAEVLWNDFLRHNPGNPEWSNRDRFVLSNGHGSMLLYSLLHLCGYDLGIEELKRFRQLHSKTPGHPEYGYAPGIETTTGPLGQGFANGVGMAIAEKVLSERFNRAEYNVVDHHTYVFLGDGCLMEGISHEVASLAGVLGLSKLICIYDDNGISIDGEVTGWLQDDTVKRFEAYRWQAIGAVDGHDPTAIAEALTSAMAETDKPTLICCRTQIGFGSPNKAGTASAHGSPLGEAEVLATRKSLGWEYEPFEIPDDIYEGWDHRPKGGVLEEEWNELFGRYQQSHPELAAEYKRRLEGELPETWDEEMAAFIQQTQSHGESIASRKASQNSIEVISPLLPELVGGSADLAGSNLTMWSGSKALTAEDASGNYIYFGVREFGMTAIMNGMTLHGGFIPYCGTFLMFMEYARNAVRMSALMKLRNIFVYTHDSIGQGEDGPTHQPIEQITNLRTTPNMSVWRPCDATETAVAWKCAVERRKGPTSLILSRQTIVHQHRSTEQLADIARGAYVLQDCDATPAVILLATGSEVDLAIASARLLDDAGMAVRVVSCPCLDVFAAQPEAYRERVIPTAVRKRIAIEAAHVDYWHKWVGLDGLVVGMSTFGESAPGGDLFREFGFTAEDIVAQVKELTG